MKKGLIIKLAIVVIVIALSYCVFWFFKAGQSEKQINKFISDNSANISAGEISVSGFPVSQKIIINDLKITIPVNLVAKRQIHIKQLEAKASIFSNNFVVALTQGVKVQELENSGDIYDVEFANQPEIMVSLANGIIAKLQYNDVGFKVLDAEKNVINSSTGTSITSETTVDETEKRVSKIHISFKELEGYTVLDFYKNVVEKRVIEGIKTEEIKVTANASQDSTPNANVANIVAEAKSAKNANNKDKDANKASAEVAVAKDIAPNSPSAVPAKDGLNVAKQAMEMANKVAQNDPNVAPPAVATTPESATNEAVAEQNNSTPETISDSSIVKSNVVIDVVVTLTPSVKEERDAPSDPTQIQELPIQYVQNIKIENLEFSNPLYKINVSGDAVNSSDDNLPSGGITIKVEKVANLLEQLKSQFKQLAESKKSSVPANGSDLNSEQAQPNQIANYDIFLNNVSDKIFDISNEIASKNSVSKDDIAQFDVRREKNLEFLVNEVPVREIIGKF